MFSTERVRNITLNHCRWVLINLDTAIGVSCMFYHEQITWLSISWRDLYRPGSIGFDMIYNGHLQTKDRRCSWAYQTIGENAISILSLYGCIRRHYLNHYWPMIVEMVSSGIHMTEWNGQDEVALKNNITTLFVRGRWIPLTCKQPRPD